MEEMADSTEIVYFMHWATSFPCGSTAQYTVDGFISPTGPFLGSPTSIGVKLFSATGKHNSKREQVQQCHLIKTKVFQVVQTVQGYLFRIARQLLCSLEKILSEKQTTFLYHFIQYTHIKK